MAGFLQSRIGLRITSSNFRRVETAKVSGLILEYSRFGETAGGDRFDPHCLVARYTWYGEFFQIWLAKTRAGRKRGLRGDASDSDLRPKSGFDVELD